MRTILGMTNSAFDPASRVRFIQFIPYLEQSGWTVLHRPNRPDRQWSSPLKGRIARGLHYRAGRLAMKVNRLRDIREARECEAVFVNRDLCGSGLFFERRLLRSNPRVIFDFDDAIFVGKSEPAVRWMCRNAAWVTPGNEYLAAYARRHNDRVTVIPTVIETARYKARDWRAPQSATVRVGWSGSDQSIRHTLFPFLGMLAELQRSIPFEFVIVANTRPVLPVQDLRWSFVPWTPESESNLAEAMDIGLMPLVNDEFQKGKCGLKLLQYMGAGLPAVASPVGVNSEITLHGETGFLAREPADWAAALETLIRSESLRASFGSAGRARCERHYSIRRWLPVLLNILDSVADGGRVAAERSRALA